MRRTGIIFGSDTGNTEAVTEVLVQQWQELYERQEIEVIEVSDIESSEQFQQFDLLILGIPTWYDGDLQSDWEDYFEHFQTIDFTNQIVAIYGLGDQIGYAEYFIDGVGILAEVVLNNGGTLIGEWPSEGFEHSESKALKDDDTFYGLPIDEDNHPDKTEPMLEQWLGQIDKEWMALILEEEAA